MMIQSPKQAAMDKIRRQFGRKKLYRHDIWFSGKIEINAPDEEKAEELADLELSGLFENFIINDIDRCEELEKEPDL